MGLKKDRIDFDNGNGNPAYLEGRLFYDSTEKSAAIYNSEADMTHQIGQEQIIRVYNNSGALITNGSIVYISGSEGVEHRPTIALGRSDAESTSEVIGFATHDIENNSFGFVTFHGFVNGLDTSSFSAGDILFLSPTVAGAFTTVKPAQPDFDVLVGFVVRVDATNGRILAQINPRLSAPAGQVLPNITQKTQNGDANDYTFGQIEKTDILRLRTNTGGGITITGIDSSNFANGQKFVIHSYDTEPITFTNEDVLSVAANRIRYSGATIVLNQWETLSLFYDQNDNRWKVTSVHVS